MNRLLTFVGGAAVGASLMFLFDVDRGKRHRAMLRDQLVHLYATTEDGLATAARDLSHRLSGQVAELRSRFGAEEVPDGVLEARIRSRIGRLVSHPGAIEVAVSQGNVTLSGPILSHEVDLLLPKIASMPGVRSVENRLEPHETAEDVPGLQGYSVPPGERFELLQENWAPTARLFVSLAGGMLALYGLRRRGLVGLAAGTLGVGALARALTNIPLPRLLGFGAGRRAVDIHKTINISAPVGTVFAYFRHPEYFPRFMSRVREVRDLGDGRYHWTVLGPAGALFEFDAEITRLEENRLLAWRSVPGSVIGNAGVVHFQTNPDGSTRVDVQMSYNPPLGALGHAVASLLGFDPKHAMDEDFVRLKSLLEYGKTTAHGETVTREEIERSLWGRPQEPGAKAA